MQSLQISRFKVNGDSYACPPSYEYNSNLVYQSSVVLTKCQESRLYEYLGHSDAKTRSFPELVTGWLTLCFCVTLWLKTLRAYSCKSLQCLYVKLVLDKSL